MIDLQKVPNTSGVYKFFNKQEIIYIGKAKDLKMMKLVLDIQKLLKKSIF